MPALTSPHMWTRETRLLVLTLVIAAAALGVLSRFRFPDTARAAPPAPPLERLAARVTYDELASIVERLGPRVSASVLVLRASPAAGPALSLRELLRAEAGPAAPTFLPALRVQPDLALVFLPEGLSVQSVVGDEGAVPLVVAEDRLRKLALIRVPRPPEGSDWQWQPDDLPDQPRYVAAIEGTRGGSAPRPIFLGRATRFDEPRWATPLLALGSTAAVAEGAVLMAFDGRVVGMAVRDGSATAAVPATALAGVTEVLLSQGVPVSDFGVTLQPLTGPLARALGTTAGVLVAGVAEGSPAGNVLRPGDVIQRVDGQPVGHVERVLLALARVAPGHAVALVVHRDGGPVEMALVAGSAAGQEPITMAWPGVTLSRNAPAVVTTVVAGSAAAAAGLAVGDAITFVADRRAPDGRTALARLAAVPPGTSVLVGLVHGGEARVAALERR